MPKRPRSSCQQVINTMPYFGPFARRRVTFVVEESRTTVLVDNQHITNRLDFTQGRSGRSIKDRCIAFLHATGRDGAHCEYNVPSPKPPTLKFFCERRIWLSGETPLGMRLGGSQVQPVSEADPESKRVAVVRCARSADGWRDEETQNQRAGLSLFRRIRILYARSALPAVVACGSTFTRTGGDLSTATVRPTEAPSPRAGVLRQSAARLSDYSVTVSSPRLLDWHRDSQSHSCNDSA